MFAYGLKLGMTEDEAYRRIEVARLARRYPVMFPLLANGQLSISAVALLKHYVSDQNHLELIAAITGRSVVQTRELIAARFPRPDVASSVRKLPERRSTMPRPLIMSTPAELSNEPTKPPSNGTELPIPSVGTSPMQGSACPRAAEAVNIDGSMSDAATIEQSRTTCREPPTPSAQAQRPAPRVSSRIEPLSPNVIRCSSQRAPSSRASSSSPGI